MTKNKKIKKMFIIIKNLKFIIFDKFGPKKKVIMQNKTISFF
tara:strand:- start:332 stop:457 length:126 start_codon:yes stop_codon:yes gene_type:complete